MSIATEENPASVPGPLIRLTAIAKQIPSLRRTGRNGRDIHFTSWHRWALHGSGPRRVKLRTVRIGSALATTERWILAFFEELAGEGAAHHSPTTRRQRIKRTARAEARLASDGI